MGAQDELTLRRDKHGPSSGGSTTSFNETEKTDRSLPSGSRAVLLVPDASMDLERLGACLRTCSLIPIVLPRAEQLAHLLARWRPLAAVVGGGTVGLEPLLCDFETRAVPVVFVGSADQIRLAASVATIEVGIPAPSDAHEIASALRLVMSSTPAELLMTERGTIRIDPMQGQVWIDDRLVELPPREFALLAELARHLNKPVPAVELAHRAWPGDAYVTGQDVYRAIYRLRCLIGDRERPVPLIQNRRGFGYVLRTRPPRE